jgi:hypothetical protein
MIFSKGTKVRIRHTGDEGKVEAMLDNGMVKVMLQGGMDIPVFPDDLENLELEALPKKPVSFLKKQEKVAPTPIQSKPQYTILKSLGLQLGFLPHLTKEGMVTEYSIYLINDFDFDIMYDFYLTFLNAPAIESDGLINGMSYELIGTMLYDRLNDAPEIEIDVWPITTAGKGEKETKVVKIKAKTFFSNVITAPLLDKKVHNYKLFEKFLEDSNPKKEEDLRTYTKRKTGGKMEKFYREPSDWNDVKRVSEFINEIDLHIEYLSDDFDKLDNGAKLRLQLNVFDKYMEKAIRLGVPKVFIIHGVGKGKLKDAIATRLIKMEGIASFKNEFHPKYGWGATEVDLT